MNAILSKSGAAVLGASALLLAGCVMPDQLSQMQKDLADVRQQLRAVQADQASTKEKVAALETTDGGGTEEPASRADVADLGVRVDQVVTEISITDERLSEIARRVDQLSQQVQLNREGSRVTSRPLPVPTDPSSGPAGGPDEDEGVAGLPDPQLLYNTAYTDFSKGNYALAISGFQEFAEKFPGTSQADNALYWIGECHFSQGNFSDAVAAFDQLLETYPGSDKSAAANLKKGLAYLEQNQVGQAIIQLRYVVTQYGSSDEAKIARDKLTSLGASF